MTRARFRREAILALLAFVLGCGSPPPKKPVVTLPVYMVEPPPPKAKVTPGKGKDPCPMVLVPEGAFLRGSLPGQGEDDEMPQRGITLDAFYLDTYAVSVAQYRRCFETKACTEPDTEKLCNWGQPDRDDHPINCVSWEQARSYCAWAGKRLPTEAEREKATRGTDGRAFTWGAKLPDCSLANYDKGGEHYCQGQTVPITAFPNAKSPYGAVQLAGNVYEWAADWYGKEYYHESAARNPIGPATGKHRVVRGGSWFNPPPDLRSALRGLIPPGMRLNYVGFRCAGDP
jgi:eukaryotic-like serine/threonine-protein kinase